MELQTICGRSIIHMMKLHNIHTMELHDWMSTEFHNKLGSLIIMVFVFSDTLYVITGKLKGQGRIDF